MANNRNSMLREIVNGKCKRNGSATMKHAARDLAHRAAEAGIIARMDAKRAKAMARMVVRAAQNWANASNAGNAFDAGFSDAFDDAARDAQMRQK